MRVHVILRQRLLPPRALLIPLLTFVVNFYPSGSNEIDSDAPFLARDSHGVHESQLSRLGARIALLVWITPQCTERAHVDDARACAGHVLMIALRLGHHVRDARRAYREGRREVCVHVRLPLLQHVWVIHALAILPVRIRDSAVVDKHVDSSAKKVGGLLDFLADLRDVAEIAKRGAEAVLVLLQMDLGGVVQFVFIDVENEDFVPIL